MELFDFVVVVVVCDDATFRNQEKFSFLVGGGPR